jgi:hypothetical protein
MLGGGKISDESSLENCFYKGRAMVIALKHQRNLMKSKGLALKWMALDLSHLYLDGW